MDNNTVIRLLTDFRSYKFAVMNLNKEGGELKRTFVPVYSERKPKYIGRYNITYDQERYTRIVDMVESAINYVLSDDQRTIIMRKYIDRNTMTLSEIADAIGQDRKTVGTKHKSAVNQLAKALLPISDDYMEITNLDHMFDPNWEYNESA